jgi:DNA-3-methyladenine glycosylase
MGASNPSHSPIRATWFARSALEVAPALLGCSLVRQFSNGTTLRGLIVETEAYTPGDPAMHAYRRRTTRNSVLFGAAGISYVYLIYGLYHCFNVVTDEDGTPSAVLIRALQLDAIPSWLDSAKPAKVAAGPGKLCRALQIDRSLTAQPLHPGNPLWLEHRSQEMQRSIDQQTTTFVQTTRIGLTQGTDLPWRWYIKDCRAVSRL